MAPPAFPSQAEQWRQLFEAITDAVMILDRDYRVIETNAATAELLGLDREAILGHRCYRVVHQRDDPRPGCTVKRTLASGRREQGEFWVELLNRHLRSVAYPLTDEAGEVTHVVHILRDITERKLAEERLEKYAAELERSNKELERFAYVASHDLQEPLRTISSYVKLLERRYKGRLDSDADDFITFVTDGTDRLQQMIEGLLAYSRVGTRAQQFKPIATEEILEQVEAGLEVAIKEAGAKVTHDPLPTVNGDATQLGQLFLNLLSNGLKFHGKRPPEIHIAARQEGEGWLFSVADNGIGINPEYVQDIFDIFRRLHPIGDYPGTGMGLAVSKRIVERHGGRIWLESKPGEGSTFYFTIPAKGGPN